MWGFTRAEQDNLQIPGYPVDQTKIFCAQGDLVCNDTLTITAAHLSYGRNADESGAFLAQMAQQAGAAAGGAAGGAAGAATGAATGAASGAASGNKKNGGGLFGGLFGN